MPLTKAINIEVERSAGFTSKYSLSCELDGNRYHVWVDVNSREPESTLYKNCPIHLNRGDQGYFPARKLSTGSVFGARLVKDMMDYAKAHDLFTKAEEVFAQQEAEEKRSNEARGLIFRKKEAGVELYEALDIYVSAVGNTAAFVDRQTLQLAFEKAQAAFKIVREGK
jgi:uncharacterized FAD-dependent dehydrogenase